MARVETVTDLDQDKHDPIAGVVDALERARTSESGDASAIALATVDQTGRPSARMVLLRGIDRRGFVFFTNYSSRKARDLDGNPRAALCAYWPSIGEQIRVEGTTERLSGSESDAYFASRPRESQISAWASPQSEPLVSREDLERRWRDTSDRFANADVPRPDFWGGYRLLPDRIEFWYSRDHRLHDRLLYVLEGGAWRQYRLGP
jgi:pyridoxamine 5'-phosphate oxidase